MNSTSDPLVGAASEYVAQTRRLNSLGSTTEETFYPAICDLLSAILRTHDTNGGELEPMRPYSGSDRGDAVWL